MENQQQVNLPDTLMTPAQVIAARLWFRVKKLESIGSDLGIRTNDVLDIMDSAEYVTAVANLMLSTRSPANLKKWMQCMSHDEMVLHIAERMGLSIPVAEKLIEKVLDEIM